MMDALTGAPEPTVRALRQWALRLLDEAQCPSPAADCRQLLCWSLGCTSSGLLLRTTVAQDEYDRFCTAVHRRTEREPLQHIVGTAPFMGDELAVGPGVFIPRPETELLAHTACTIMAQQSPGAQPTLVDFCAGTGALGIAIAQAHPGAHLIAVEYSDRALPYLRRNCATFLRPDQVTILHGDAHDSQLLHHIQQQTAPTGVEMVVCNPPYVPEGSVVDPETRRDPSEAVFSGATGMDFLALFIPQMRSLLADGGWLICEHDETTGAATQELFHHYGYHHVTQHQDLVGRDRYVVGQWSSATPSLTALPGTTTTV